GNNAVATGTNLALSGPTVPFQVLDWTSGSVASTALFANGTAAQMSYASGSRPAWDFSLGTESTDDFGGIGFSPYDANLGAGFPDPQFGEILFYDRVLDTCERQAIEGYLAWKWGLQS